MSDMSPYGFLGPDTTILDQMIDANGGFYGPDTSWIQTEMDQLFGPSNPYLVDAMIETTGDFNSVSNSANADWDDYFIS